MPFNGSGTFNPATSPSPAYPAVTGTTIEAAQVNTIVADIATGLTNALTRDGQSSPTADLPMGTKKHTGVGDGTARTHYPSLGQLQDGIATKLSSVAGADTITATAPLGMTAYATGQIFEFVAAGDNTGAVTLNLNSLGAKAVTKKGAVALAAGELLTGMVGVVVYDGTRFQLINPVPVNVGDLLAANNLSELTATAATARTNLGLGTASTKATGTTTGNVPLWESLLLNSTAEKTADYEVLTTDRGKLIDFTGTGSWTLSTASGLLAAGFVFAVRNSGTGVITINPYSGELVDDVSSLDLGPGESCIVAPNDGATGWRTVGRSSSAGNPIATTVLTSGTSHTLNAKTTHVVVEAVGGGGGGAVGGGASSGGGGSGSYLRTKLLSSGGAGSLSFAIGAGGSGGPYPSGSGGTGGTTTVTINGTTFTAPGGSGGTTTNAGAGGYPNDTNNPSRFCLVGNNGGALTTLTGAPSAFSTWAAATVAGVNGGGGGGSDIIASGGAGGAGVLIITEYKL